MSSHLFLMDVLDSMKGHHTDLLLVPGNVSAHKSLLAQLSPLLASLMNSLDHSDSEMLTLVLPHVESSTVDKLVELVYTGRYKLWKLFTFFLTNDILILGVRLLVQNCST